MGLGVVQLAALVEAFGDLAEALLSDHVLAVLLLGAFDARSAVGMRRLADDVQRRFLRYLCLDLLFLGLDGLRLLLLLHGDVELELFGGGLDGPIIDIVHLYLIRLPGRNQQALEVLIIRLLLKLQSLGVIDKRGELIRKPFGQKLSRRGYLLLHDHLVLGLGVLGLHVLPGKDTSQQIHHHISDRLDVVSPRLLDAHVGVDARIPGRASELLSLLIRDVLV